MLAVTYPWASASSYLSSQSVADSRCNPHATQRKERKQTTQGRDGRTVHRHHTGISRRGQCGASRHLPLGACLFLSLFAVCRRFSLQPSCHPAVFLLSTFSLPSLLPLCRPPIPPLGCLFYFFLSCRSANSPSEPSAARTRSCSLRNPSLAPFFGCENSGVKRGENPTGRPDLPYLPCHDVCQARSTRVQYSCIHTRYHWSPKRPACWASP